MTRGVTAVLVSGVLGLAACGSSRSDTGGDPPAPPRTMTGGASATGGASTPGGMSSAGGANGGATTAGQGGQATGGSARAGSAPLRDACRTYVAAYCQRQSECDGSGAEGAQRCTGGNGTCPDLLMSPGSAHSLENLLSCAEQLRTADCTDWRRGITPACVVPGTRAKGEPCVFRSQCQSSSCNKEDIGAPCGFCRGLAEPGGACNSYDLECPKGQRCEEDGLCADVPATEDPAPVVAVERAAEGEACGAIPCEIHLYCSYPGGASEGTCRAFPAIGEPCAENTTLQRCGPDAYCGAAGCTALPGAGEACVTDHSVRPCAEDLYCVSGTCTPLAAVGEKCEPSPLELVTSICKTGLVCACQDAECRMGACQSLAREGAACGASGVVCEHGTICEGGVCRASDALTGQAICDLRD